MIRGGLRAAGLALFLAVACSQSSGATSRCVFENGAMGAGRCLTECESRCALEVRAGCAPPDCTTACDAKVARWSSGCADARYTEWRCLRIQGLPQVTCSADAPQYAVPDGKCGAETQEVARACAGQTFLDGGGDANAP